MSEKIEIGPYTQGEVPSPIQYSFFDSQSEPLYVDDYDAHFQLQKPDGDVVLRGASVDAETVTYVWQDEDMDQPGHYQAIFWVNNGTNRFASTPLHYIVRRAPSIEW